MRDFIQRRRDSLSKSAGGFQSALLEAGVVKQSQVDATRKEERDPEYRFYVNNVHPDAVKTLENLIKVAKHVFQERRTPETYLEWRELELMVDIEKAYVATKTHNFICHLVAAFAARTGEVKPAQGGIANSLRDPISRAPLSHTTKAPDIKQINNLKTQPLESEAFAKAYKSFAMAPETAVTSPVSQTLLGGITFRALKRWVQMQQLLENQGILKLLRK